MLSPEEIDEQQKLLATYRHTLAIYLKQRAMIGHAYSPPALITGIEEARGNIKRIKAALRGGGVVVPDDPDDESTTTTLTPPAALSAPSRSRRPWVWLVVIDVIVLALVVGGWWFYSQPIGTASQEATSPAIEATAPLEETPSDVTPSEEAGSTEPSTAELENQLQEANISLSETQVEAVRGFINDSTTGYKSFAEHVLPIVQELRFRQTLYLDEMEDRYTQLVGSDKYADFDEEQLKAGMVRAWNERYTDQQVESFDQIVEPRS
jgi:hypothetical protein